MSPNPYYTVYGELRFPFAQWAKTLFFCSTPEPSFIFVCLSQTDCANVVTLSKGIRVRAKEIGLRVINRLMNMPFPGR
jgi:hypothetical protein